MPSTPQLTFAQLMEIRGAAEKMLGNKTSLPPIHKDLMQYWTTAEAKAFYESGGLSFPCFVPGCFRVGNKAFALYGGLSIHKST